MTFEQANQAIHPVTTQWHYDTMIAAGFIPETLEQTGFVRAYKYTKGNHVIWAHTGASYDYWIHLRDETTEASGLWGTLKAHVNSIDA